MHSVKLAVAGLAAATWAAATLAASPALAAGVLDQDSAPLGGRFLESLNWQQEVTAGLSGQLMGLTLYGDGTSVDVGVSSGDAYQSGPFQFSGHATLSDAGVFVDTSAANILLTAGDRFVIDLRNGSGGNILEALHTYSGGDLWLNFGVAFDDTAQTGQSLAFQTFMGPAPAGAPEPATWAILLTGFAGLGAALRRRRALAA